MSEVISLFSQEGSDFIEARNLLLEDKIEAAYVNLKKRIRELEAENADLRLKVEELGALCNRKARQCCHKDKIISSLDLENAALKRELAGEMEKY